MHEDTVEQARRQVAESERRVAAQKRLTADLERDGHDTVAARRLLAVFEAVLTSHREHLKLKEAEASWG
ncbi:MAG TPA: hypothetical protein VGS12_15085 [Caulobacteraceae bacterium]|nr:hypothetical protein [Caulobacteraceae bacterium]